MPLALYQLGKEMIPEREKPNAKPLRITSLGRRRYSDVLALQERLQAERLAAYESGSDAAEQLLLLEHDPVYTWGRRTKPEHMGAGVEALRALGADTFEVGRGGEVTFHGPGQIVAYPIVHLKNLSCGRDLHRYMRGLEETMIRVIAHYGLKGERLDGATGVWVPRPGRDSAKVGALGVRVRKWVTMHGFALNVSTDLSWFRQITPCGIEGRVVTSLAELLGEAPDFAEVQDRIVEAFCEVFGLARM